MRGSREREREREREKRAEPVSRSREAKGEGSPGVPAIRQMRMIIIQYLIENDFYLYSHPPK